MLAYLLVGLIAACAAAPRFPGPPPFHPGPFDARQGFGHHRDPFADEFFDTRQFWSNLATEMRELDTMLVQFYEKFPAITSQQGVEGNEYKITIPLSGFEEQDLVVKAKHGLLMVQAVHKLEGGGERSYLDIKTLPSYVNVTGTWTFESSVLKIVFPLKADAAPASIPVTEEPITEGVAQFATQSHSREEMDSQVQPESDADADVGVRGDRKLYTNEIPRNTVEATTYAVDLKNEVEFVPVRFK